MTIPDPALVVLVGAAGSGKSHWAAEHYRPTEIVSSDALRAVVGSGPADLDASADAFALLESIVSARLGRGLTTVIDTLGLDAGRRRAWRVQAAAAGLPAAVVVVATDAATCRRRNADRDRPVPAPVLADQLRRVAEVGPDLAAEGWDVVTTADSAPEPAHSVGAAAAGRAQRSAPRPLSFVLQVSRFDWDDDPAGWLRSTATAAAEAGLDGLALMDHLIQIPQVGRDFDPIPEPWVTLGWLAALPTSLRLGTLVSPLSIRRAGVLAKSVATLDVLTGGRAFCGVGAGWWAREHAAYDLPFATPAARLDALEAGIETLRALWAPGTKPYRGERVTLPETTCYPRPVGTVPVIVGGAGARTLAIAGRHGDAVNVSSDITALPGRIAAVQTAAAGRDVAITVLDVPVIGRDRDAAADQVERLRGRTSAATFGARHHAGTVTDHIGRYRQLADLGVTTVFVALPAMRGPDDLAPLADVVAAFS